MSENITNNEDFNNDKFRSGKNVDEVQALIRQKMHEDEVSGYYENNFDNGYDDYSSVSNYDKSSETNKNGKKYVIRIKPENIDFFDSLAPEKRVDVVNTIISVYRDEQKGLPDVERTKKFVKHLIVVIVTLAIGFPLVFYLINASIEATANSYREVQNNFEKLYQQKGGVQRKNLNKLQNLQY